MPVRLACDWLIGFGGPPVRSAAVLIGPDGRVIAAGPADAVPDPVDARRIECRNAAVLPGLVNVHTHLELTGLEGRVESDEFPQWIRALRLVKAERTPEQFRAAARQGVRDCFAAGVTTVADTGDSGAVLPALAEAGGSGIVYQEVFGPDPAQLETSLAGLESMLAALAPAAGPRLRLGVSPHAPYTVSGPLYRAVADLARRRELPIAIHIAESRAETAFVTRNEGAFAEAWRARGIPPLARQGSGAGADPLRSPVAWVDHHGALGPSTLCIHAVELDDADLDLLAERGVAIAHCPISNERHGHRAAPLAEMRRRGIRVGAGTDSVVSVGRLDLMAELRAARRLGGLSAEDSLRLATTGAAAALGLEREIGRLAPGFWGDFVVIDLPPDLGSGDAVEAVLASGPGAVRLTAVAGRTVHARGRLDSPTPSALQ